MLSVVIPAKDEAQNVGQTILRVFDAFSNAQLPAPEVIVVDNGSTDSTVDVAAGVGASVLRAPGITVGACRNLGANAAARGHIAFLDADMFVMDQWARGALLAIALLEDSSVAAVGGRCMAPQSSGWVGAKWFSGKRSRTAPSHIGSGQMLVRRDTFFALGGFNESLATGEDVDFCDRAKRLGKELKTIPELVSIHHGSPLSLKEFWFREVWHGQKRLNGLSFGRTEALAFIFGLIHVALFVSAWRSFSQVAALSGFALFGLLFASYKRRFQVVSSFRDLAQGFALFYVYYWARLVGLVRASFGKAPYRRSGAGRQG
jgi:glycosyltransferase involved in cell wall biosynthesis